MSCHPAPIGAETVFLSAPVPLCPTLRLQYG